MDKNVLKEFTAALKLKYPIQDLKLQYEEDKRPHIYLSLIRIRRMYRCQGIGSMVMSEVLKFADENQIEVWLYATNIYGSDLQRLYNFYLKQGFQMTNKKDGRFKYKPKKVL